MDPIEVAPSGLKIKEKALTLDRASILVGLMLEIPKNKRAWNAETKKKLAGDEEIIILLRKALVQKRELFAQNPQKYIRGWLDKIQYVVKVLLHDYVNEDGFPTEDDKIAKIKHSIMEHFGNLLLQNQTNAEKDVLYAWEGWELLLAHLPDLVKSEKAEVLPTQIHAEVSPASNAESRSDEMYFLGRSSASSSSSTNELTPKEVATLRAGTNVVANDQLSGNRTTSISREILSILTRKGTTVPATLAPTTAHVVDLTPSEAAPPPVAVMESSSSEAAPPPVAVMESSPSVATASITASSSKASSSTSVTRVQALDFEPPPGRHDSNFDQPMLYKEFDNEHSKLITLHAEERALIDQLRTTQKHILLQQRALLAKRDVICVAYEISQVERDDEF